jgi:hypothetical protein
MITNKVALGLVIAFLVFACPSVSADQRADWTILIYMNANNNLESDAIDNYKQMMAIGSSKNVKVIVEFARRGNDKRFEGWNSTYRLEVKKNEPPLKKYAIEDIGIRDMGDGKTLTDFVSWGRKKYPASHYMLVIWDHGQGWRIMSLLSSMHLQTLSKRNFEENSKFAGADGASPVRRDQSVPNPVKSSSYDEASGHFLYNRELADSVRSALGNEKLDILAFDACLMAMMESAYAFKDIADYLAASEELEPGLGWNYTIFLQKINETSSKSSASVASLIVAAYKQAYSSSAEGTTMSVVDLSSIDQLGKSISALSGALVSQLASNPQTIESSRASCAAYGASAGYASVDIMCFLDALLSSVHDNIVLVEAAKSAQDTLSRSIVASYASQNRKDGFGSHGLAIYFPPNGAWFKSDPDHDAYDKTLANAPNAVYPVEFVKMGGWSDFVSAYTSRF